MTFHDHLVRESVGLYMAHLTTISATDGQELSGVVEQLLESLKAALTRREALSTNDVPFTASALMPLKPHQRLQLVNQWALGLGNPEAPIIVMGTEAAYDVSGEWLVGLAVESCGSPILWLCDDDGTVAAHLASESRWLQRRGWGGFQRHPKDFYGVRSWWHTWWFVARVAGVHWSRLGDVTYQIERSAHASRTASRGKPPTPERLRLLRQLLESTPAVVLLLHGHAIDAEPEWAAANEELVDAFCRGRRRTVTEHRFERYVVRTIESDSRTVVLAPFLNGRMKGLWPGPLLQIAELVARAGGAAGQPT